MTLQGTLFLMVGPSGVGKDTLLEGAQDRLGEFSFFRFCRRYITRDPDAGGEDYITVSPTEFRELQEKKFFFHHWDAHGLRYGIPINVLEDLHAGRHVIVNVSRKELEHLSHLWEETVVLSVTASPATVLKRLKARDRESEADIQARALREVKLPPLGCRVLTIRNDASPEEGVETLVRALIGTAGQHFTAQAADLVMPAGVSLCTVNQQHPVAEILRAHGSRVEIMNRAGKSVVADLGYTTHDDISDDFCMLDKALAEKLDIENEPMLRLRPAPSPQSRAALRKKIRGEELSDTEMDQVVEDMMRGRYSQSELAAFLVCAAKSLTTPEVIALARARAIRTENVHWSAPIVLDKQSMGGIPGNRISPIIIPIVTAAGLLMPKTSSRAITSASGTADAMEVLAKVDLTPDEMRNTVGQAGGCIAWNGNLTHSPVDDVMNAINRPLGLKSARLDVSSILSKKLAAGATHVLIDLPVGPEAKTTDMDEAKDLERLFVVVARELGIKVRVMKVDGTKPVGRGVGPALEIRDALAVLSNDETAPADLREKAIYYAGILLEWSGYCGMGEGQKQATAILQSGEALAQFDKIINAQGRQLAQVPEPEQLCAEIHAPSSKIFEGFSVKAVSAIARAAGAPIISTAGVDLLVVSGDTLNARQPVMRIHAATSHALQQAVHLAELALEENTLFSSSNEICLGV